MQGAHPWVFAGLIMLSLSGCGGGAGEDAPAPLPAPSLSHTFTTLPPGSPLPSGELCVQWVQEDSRGVEKRPENAVFNLRVGRALNLPFFDSDPNAYDQRANTQFASRVNGNFTGTTEDILRWGACKWGIDEDMVRAIAVTESWWRQSQRSNWTTTCPPAHPAGSDDPVNHPQECLRDHGLMQLNYEHFSAAWPEAEGSSAMNVDVALMTIRSCFEGYELWLANTAPQGRPYVSGDLQGCLSRYYSGRWYSPEGLDYAHRVQGYFDAREWEKPTF